MRLEPFRMERWQSRWENEVEYNLSESGVEPLRLEELLDPGELGGLGLGYPPSRGSPELRSAIAALYPGATPENVVVTSGTSEANLIAACGLVDGAGDAVVMVPNYLEIQGVATMAGSRVVPFHLRPESGRWAPDLDELEAVVTERTRLIAVCNPNNPTGAVLTEAEREAILGIAERVGAWIVADEVYQGAEFDGRTTPSFWGGYERVVVTCGLSKAYGLPGLRIGWAVGPAATVEALWSYKDYTTLTPTALSDRLATAVLEPARRGRILERTRAILRERYPIVERWAAGQGEALRLVPPRAGAIALLEYAFEVDSLELAERLRLLKSVLVVPGEHFGIERRCFRVGFGYDAGKLAKGLARIAELLGALEHDAAASV